MPGAVREGDAHVGHASGTPNPFHRTTYVSGQSTVFVNGKPVIRHTDSTTCGDSAAGRSVNVFAESFGIHRLGDATTGHGTFVGNAAAQASTNVIINSADTTTQTNSPDVVPTPVTYIHYVVINYSGDIASGISFNFSGEMNNLAATSGQFTFDTTSSEGIVTFTHFGSGADGFSSITSDNGDGATWDGTTLGNLGTVNGGTTTFTLVAQSE